MNLNWRKMQALWIIALVVGLPLYSVDVSAASVQITKNTGKVGIENFIDGAGDVWTVQAQVSAVETVNPEEMKITIGTNEVQFNSCSGAEAFGVSCEYVSPLSNGVKSGSYTFEVSYVPGGVSDSTAIHVDGDAPTVNLESVIQEKEKVRMSFTVEEGTPCVGLQKIEIVDAGSNEVLQTISSFGTEPGTEQCSYNFAESESAGILKASVSGEGTRSFKIRAEDRFGHSATSNPLALTLDFVKPSIQENSLSLVDFGKFIGSFEAESDVTINVTEHALKEVLASSEQGAMKDVPGKCALTGTLNVYSCTWEKVKFQPAESISITFTAVDDAGNEEVKTITPPSFTKDSAAPETEYFGTQRNYGEQSFVKDGDNVFVLRVKEVGAGIDENHVKLDLGEVGGSTAQKPDACEHDGEAFECRWKVSKGFGSQDTARVTIAQLEDNVGNEGKLETIEVQADNTAPKIAGVELYGVTSGAKHNYFQSKDVFHVELRVEEFSGLRMLLDARELVMDAEQLYLETGDVPAGWIEFTEEACEKKEAAWNCVLETPAVKSGYDSLVPLEIRVSDTAGNAGVWTVSPRNVKSGERGKYNVELLGVEEEANPDFWGVAKVTPLVLFVDLDVTQLAKARIPIEVKLKPATDEVKVLEMGLAGDCTSEDENAPVLSRSLLYGGVSTAGESLPKPKIILEFEPFNGRELFGIKQTDVFTTREIKYKCSLKISSQAGKKVVQGIENQEVMIKVPFGFSTLGAQDENLEELIKKEKEAVETGLWGAIGTMQKILVWVDYGVQAVHLVTGAISLVSSAKTATDAFKPLPGGQALSVAECFGLTTVEKNLDTRVGWIDVPIQVLSCRPTPEKLGWYGKWQETVLSMYNLEILKSPTSPLGAVEGQFKPGRDVRQNLYLSMATLCVPGIVKNLDKYRQIKCRKIYCLQNEVKAGLTTVSGCNELEGLLTCKYFVGELWYIFPFSQFWDSTIRALGDAWKDPIALVHTVNIAYCGLACPVSGQAASFCSYSTYIWSWVDYLEQIANLITTVKADFESGGLQYCDSVLK
ncbi:hypothetical protein HYX14_05735 [Candidatus Woesearchaeota archaeon]|nr:hypothetical protein [Candidatus Woesearchaeota archaeon]